MHVNANATAILALIWLKLGVLMHAHVRYILLNPHLNISSVFKVIKFFVSPV